MLQARVYSMGKLRDDRRRPVDLMPAIAIPFSEPFCCDAFSSRQISILLGQWPAPGGQEGLHEVYTTNHDAPAGGSPSR